VSWVEFGVYGGEMAFCEAKRRRRTKRESKRRRENHVALFHLFSSSVRGGSSFFKLRHTSLFFTLDFSLLTLDFFFTSYFMFLLPFLALVGFLFVVRRRRIPGE